MLRVATDIGGTFTDVAFYDVDESGAAGPIRSFKADTVPADLPAGVLQAMAAAQIDLTNVAFFAHGSTVVINALTERKGVRTGLITTRGFRDVLEIARGNRPDLYNFRYRKPPPFVPRRLRLEADERTSAKGDVLRPLDLDSLDTAIAALQVAGVEAVAVCFLHAYANPENERAAALHIRQRWPGVPVIASHQTTREWREYERTSTTVLSAYVAPVVERYLEALGTRLAAGGLRQPPFIMQSNGGVATVEAARRNPVALAESGPASGVLGAAVLARENSRRQVIALDIGGTTAKCSLIDGAPQITTDYHIEASRTNPGYPIKVPVIDIVEIGTGGGSIAAVDAGGRLQVGPHSAGADPGPIVYGRGGTALTVTDAHVLTGRIDPAKMPRKPADLDAVREAFAALGAPLGLDGLAMAQGVLRVAEVNMENALKLVSINRGHDPRDLALIAYGGGGPLHACALAAALHIPEVIIPKNAAVFSACGMLQTDLRRDVVQSFLMRLDGADAAAPQAICERLEQDARTAFADDGIEADRLIFEHMAEMRYLGQEHTVRVTLGGAPKEWPERFRAAYEQLYRVRLDLPVEIVTFHVIAHGLITRPALPLHPTSGLLLSAAQTGVRSIDFLTDGVHETPVFERDLLAAGAVIQGPAAIEEAGAVTILAPGQRAEVDGHGHLIIEVPADA
jgi:N-methylhydantoinase A